MSLHVTLTPEADARLRAQKRNSTISAALVAVLSVFLIGVVLALILMELPVFKPKETVAYAASTPNPENINIRKVQTNHKQRKPSRPSAATKAISSKVPSNIVIPDVPTDNISMSFGTGDTDGDEYGEGWDDGGGGSGPIGIATPFKKRCTQKDRLERLNKNGGTPECEEAVVAGLRWMKNNQLPNGSWKEGGKPVAMTGLALLAYLGHCETPSSIEFGDSCLRAITYLVDVGQKSGGALASSTNDKHWPYEHAIATYALAEAYTLCRGFKITVPGLKEVVENAGQMIIDRQHAQTGAWCYNYDSTGKRGGDLSIAGWHIQALKACKHTGLEFNGIRGSWKEAEKFIEKCSNNQGGFGYTGPKGLGSWGYDSLTGVGVLSMQMMGRKARKTTRAGLRYIVDNSKFDYNSAWCDLYAHYYEGQACMNAGGRTWNHYNKLFRDQLLQNRNADGSWKRPGGGDKPNAVQPLYGSNAHYRTALCVLMLEVYYRFLPGTGEN